MPDRPPLLLLHAFPHSSKMWKANLSSLSKNYRCIVPDLAGFGNSVLTPWKMPDAADMIDQVLKKEKIIGPVFVGGVSMGGYMAFEFLRKFPQRVAGLGLFGTRATPDTEDGRIKREQSILAIEKFGLEAFVRKAVKSQLGRTTQDQNSGLVDEVLSWMKEARAEAAVNAIKAMMGRRDSTELLLKFKGPALVIAGEEDELCPPAEMKAMANLIPQAEFYIIRRSGHLVNLEVEKDFNEIVAEFLASRYSGRA